MSTYTIKNNDKTFSLHNASRPYILKINDLPESDKPREKMIANGPSLLSTTELIAVILNTGSIKEDVLSMSQRIVKEYGEKSFMTFMDSKKVAQSLDIPIHKATQLVAASELGRRFYKRSTNNNVLIRNAEDVFDYVRDMRELSKEHLRGLYLNAHHKIIHDEIISIGTVDANIVHPREVFKPALEFGAVAVVLVHNHPSGVITPSASDRDITNQLIEAGKIMGINLIDHVVIAGDKYMSVPVNYE